MKKYKVFISSVQKELFEEREALYQYFTTDSLLSLFFEPFLFEKIAAAGNNPQKTYTSELLISDIYLGIIGVEYGYIQASGLSATEEEYDAAKKHGLQRWLYIKNHESAVLPKVAQFVEKIGKDVSRKRVSGTEILLKEVYNSCVLFLRNNGKIEASSFDESINNDATITDINEEYIKTFITQARYKRNAPIKETASIVQVLSHLNMLRQDKVTNSAILAFGKNPQAYFPTATVKCAHFHGLEIEKPIPNYREFGGTVFQMAEEAVDFILSKIGLSTGSRALDNQVSTVYEIPRAAIAEAIINAIAHRNYESNGSIQISIFKNRIEVINPGTLPEELQLEDLTQMHSSYPHNPILAQCMFLTGHIERFGTGTLDIYNLSKSRGLISPIFSLDEGFKVVLWRPSADASDQASDQVSDQAEEAIRRLAMVMNGPLKTNEIMDILELKHKTYFRENYIKPSLDELYIEMTIPKKANSPNQKYKLTKKGLALKAEIFSKKKTKNDQVTDQVTDQVEELVKVLNMDTEMAYSRQALMILLKLKHNQNFRDKYLNPCLTGGFIAMTIPEKPSSTLQKYRLTLKGISLKKMLTN